MMAARSRRRRLPRWFWRARRWRRSDWLGGARLVCLGAGPRSFEAAAYRIGADYRAGTGVPSGGGSGRVPRRQRAHERALVPGAVRRRERHAARVDGTDAGIPRRPSHRHDGPGTPHSLLKRSNAGRPCHGICAIRGIFVQAAPLDDESPVPAVVWQRHISPGVEGTDATWLAGAEVPRMIEAIACSPTAGQKNATVAWLRPALRPVP